MSPEDRAAYREKVRLEKLAEKLAKKEELKKIRDIENQKKKVEREKVTPRDSEIVLYFE